MLNIFKAKSLHFSENWKEIRFTFQGFFDCIGAEYRLGNETFLIKPQTDRIGGYSIRYAGQVHYYRTIPELKADFRRHWKKFNTQNS